MPQCKKTTGYLLSLEHHGISNGPSCDTQFHDFPEIYPSEDYQRQLHSGLLVVFPLFSFDAMVSLVLWTANGSCRTQLTVWLGLHQSLRQHEKKWTLDKYASAVLSLLQEACCYQLALSFEALCESYSFLFCASWLQDVWAFLSLDQAHSQTLGVICFDHLNRTFFAWVIHFGCLFSCACFDKAID